MEKVKTLLTEAEFEEFLRRYQELLGKVTLKRKSDYAAASFIALRSVKGITLRKFSQIIGITRKIVRDRAKELFNVKFGKGPTEMFDENQMLEKIRSVLSHEEYERFLKHYEELKEKARLRRKSDYAAAGFIALCSVKNVTLKKFAQTIGITKEIVRERAKELFNINIKKDLQGAFFEKQILEKIRSILSNEEYEQFLKHYNELKEKTKLKRKSDYAAASFVALRSIKDITLKRFAEVVEMSRELIHERAKKLFNIKLRKWIESLDENQILEKIKSALSSEEYEQFLKHYEEIKKGKTLWRGRDFAICAFIAFNLIKPITIQKFAKIIGMCWTTIATGAKSVFNKSAGEVLREFGRYVKEPSEMTKKAIQILNDFMLSNDKIRLLEVDPLLKERIIYAVKQYKYPISVSRRKNTIFLKKLRGEMK